MNNRFFSHAEVFVAVARHGSITGAAHGLQLSKSNVSQKLTDMEQELNIKLFHRSTRKIILTPAGERLLDKCAKAVDAVSEVRSEFGVGGEQEENISGVVTVAGSNIYLSEYVLPKLHQFFEQYPNIRIQAVGSDRSVDPLSEGVDMRIRVGDILSQGVRLYPLKQIERILCIGASAKLKIDLFNHPKQINDAPIILREQENTKWIFRSQNIDWQFTASAPKMLVSSYELCVQATRNGYGLAILAKDIVQKDIDEGRIIQLLPNWEIEPLAVTLAVPYSKLLKPHVKVLAMFLSEKLK